MTRCLAIAVTGLYKVFNSIDGESLPPEIVMRLYKIRQAGGTTSGKCSNQASDKHLFTEFRGYLASPDGSTYTPNQRRKIKQTHSGHRHQQIGQQFGSFTHIGGHHIEKHVNGYNGIAIEI